MPIGEEAATRSVTGLHIGITGVPQTGHIHGGCPGVEGVSDEEEDEVGTVPKAINTKPTDPPNAKAKIPPSHSNQIETQQASTNAVPP